MAERDIERRLRKGVEALGGLCVKLPATFTAGIPDRLCLLPGGRMVFAEVKAPGGRLSKLQRLWHEKLRALGFEVAVLWSDEETDNFIKNTQDVCINLPRPGGELGRD